MTSEEREEILIPCPSRVSEAEAFRVWLDKRKQIVRDLVFRVTNLIQPKKKYNANSLTLNTIDHAMRQSATLIEGVRRPIKSKDNAKSKSKRSTVSFDY